MPHTSKGFTLRNPKGFTLVELLIVIGILAVLATTTVVVLNPVELLARGRDAKRASDIDTINKLLGVYESQGGSFANAPTNRVYVSLPDTSGTCASYSLPTLPAGWIYQCATTANYQRTDGPGWIPLNFSSIPGLSAPSLPIDPINSSSGGLYYTYVTGSWELTAKVEAKNSKKGGLAEKDGGVSSLVFEMGSKSKITPIEVVGRNSTYEELTTNESALVGYWPLDEGSGTSANDSSGNNNTGTLTNGPTWTTGQVSGALSFDGVNDYVNVPNSSSLNFGIGSFSVSAWLKFSSSGTMRVLNKFDVSAASGWLVDVNTGAGGVGSLRTKMSDGTHILDYSAAASLNNNSWHHIALSVDKSSATGLKLYIDGSQIGTSQNPTTITGSITNSVSSGIGVIPNSLGIYFSGNVDDIRIYNRALSASEVLGIYNATR